MRGGRRQIINTLQHQQVRLFFFSYYWIEMLSPFFFAAVTKARCKSRGWGRRQQVGSCFSLANGTRQYHHLIFHCKKKQEKKKLSS